MPIDSGGNAVGPVGPSPSQPPQQGCLIPKHQRPGHLIIILVGGEPAHKPQLSTV
jgi:hypothetical protein